MTNKETELDALTSLLISVGLKAQDAAMRALVAEVDKSVGDSLNDRAKIVGLAGALAFTRWKLDAALTSITKVHPQYAELVTGAQQAAAETFGDGFEESARETARKFNVPYPGRAQ